MKFNGKTLFRDCLKQSSFLLGIKDKAIISVSVRATVEMNHLKHEVFGTSSSQPKPKPIARKGRANGSRKKTSIHVPSKDEEEKLKQQHSNAMSLVFEEAKQKFKDIRKRLNNGNMKRMPPKERKVAPKPSEIYVQPQFLSDADVPKAGKTSFIVRVGDANNLYKTAKLQNKGPLGAFIDLHGLSKEQALAKLDESLPVWIDTAMKGSYPFVIQVKIVCGGGSQTLAEAVATWIKGKKSSSYKYPVRHV